MMAIKTRRTAIGKCASRRTANAVRLIGAAAALGLLAIQAAAPGSARAEVFDKSDAGFTSRNIAIIAARPADVYTCLVRDVGKWWDPQHSYSKDAGNLSIDARAGGYFLEKLPDGGSVLHFTVVNAEPGKMLRLVGAMGPLQASGVSGSLTWQLKPEGEGTSVDLVYVVGGYYPGGFETIAPLADKVLGEQLQRLKAYIERSKPPLSR